MTPTPPPPDAETLARRARIAAWVALGKRVGYAGLLLAIAAFVAGAALSFPTWTTTAATVGLVVACVALPGAIVFGYGIRAAEHEERGGGRFH